MAYDNEFMLGSGYDHLFGHYCFQTAIERAGEAKALHRVAANVKPDNAEAKRLYGVAVADAKKGIAEIEANPAWNDRCKSAVEHMRTMIAQWEGEAYTL